MRTNWKCGCCGRELGTDDHRQDECDRCQSEERKADLAVKR